MLMVLFYFRPLLTQSSGHHLEEAGGRQGLLQAHFLARSLPGVGPVTQRSTWANSAPSILGPSAPSTRGPFSSASIEKAHETLPGHLAEPLVLPGAALQTTSLIVN